MARYIGPRSKIARRFADPIFGADKYFEKNKFSNSQKTMIETLITEANKNNFIVKLIYSK